MLKENIYSLFVIFIFFYGSIKPNPTAFDIPSYFRAMYNHPEVMGLSNDYTPSVISHDIFIETIEVARQLNERVLIEKNKGIIPGKIKGEACLPETAPFIGKIMLPVDSKVIFFGDLHGSIHALIRCLQKLMEDEILDEDLRIINPAVRIVFLGDLVDYGIYGIDTLFTVLQLQLRNPDKVFMCRGNHETIGRMKGSFFNEYAARFGLEGYRLLGKPDFLMDDSFCSPTYWWQSFAEKLVALYSLFPLALFIGIDGKPQEGYVQCCHGGIDEGAREYIRELLSSDQNIVFLDMAICFQDFFCNLNWGDISGKSALEQQERYPRTLRHCVNNHLMCHTIREVQEFATDLNIKMIMRGHQDQCNSFKVTLPGIGYPIYSLVKDEMLVKYYSNDDIKRLKFLNFDIMSIFTSTEFLFKEGFTSQEFIDVFDILPVCTFSNAYAAKKLNDQGFGILIMNQSWAESLIKAYVYECTVQEDFSVSSA